MGEDRLRLYSIISNIKSETLKEDFKHTIINLLSVWIFTSQDTKDAGSD